mmetsp:Transcript_7966/g.16754  ORF Transcript_7966/g.16754 Transcript_7966/m.16754 type:complete len:413 (+) Transcript_7966:136-1374(+)
MAIHNSNNSNNNRKETTKKGSSCRLMAVTFICMAALFWKEAPSPSSLYSSKDEWGSTAPGDDPGPTTTTTTTKSSNNHNHNVIAHNNNTTSRGPPVILTEELVERVRAQILRYIQTHCQGPSPRALQCSHELAKTLCLDRDDAISIQTPTVRNFTVRFGPWLTMPVGNEDRKVLHWTANGYLDFISWYIFFSGHVAYDRERQQRSLNHHNHNNHPPPPPLSYFESGAQNGVWASNTYTLGAQLGWTGLLVEPTQCGVCDVPWNRPTSDTVHAGLCARDSTMTVPNTSAFCQRPVVRSCVPSFPTEIPCYSLPTLLGTVRPRSWIDFFSLDIEDFTLDAWNSLDHSVTNIRHAVVERRKNIPPSVFDSSVFHQTILNNDYLLWKRNAFALVDTICPGVVVTASSSSSASSSPS